MGADQIRPSMAINKEIDLRFVIGYSPAEYRESLHKLAEGDVDATPVLTGTVGLEGVDGAFDGARRPRDAREDPDRPEARRAPRSARKAEDARGGALGEDLVVRRLARDADHRALQRAHEGLRRRRGRRPRRDRAVAPPRADQARRSANTRLGHALDLAADGMVLA